MNPASRRGPRRPPVERVRDGLRHRAGAAVAARLPAGYQRLGHVLMVRWPEALRPEFPYLAEAFHEVLGVRTVLRYVGPMEGELRTPRVEVLREGPTETEVVEHGVRYGFDAARVMFAAGNRTERARAGQLVRPGDVVVDLFAGIGYFALPAAKRGGAARVVAVDRNPTALRYLEQSARCNEVADRIAPMLGDNRTVALPLGSADRVFLGYLPTAVPWIARAVPLLRSPGGWLHVHLVVDARNGRAEAETRVTQAVEATRGKLDEPVRAREVKPYGPGRTHMVVDARVGVPSA